MNIQTIKNVSDCLPLYLPHSLYLKPYAKLCISVSLPTSIPGKTISNWDVMEKLRQIILPETFSVIKISKSTLEFIRFDAEIEDKEKLRNVLNRLDGRSIKLSNFAENVKVRAKESRDGFPMKHDWDSFFRDARDMDEMKPGERPDTIHITNLPVRWFCARHLENSENVKPSENIFKRIFEKFGDVRSVDIPICDPYRAQMKSHMSGMKTFSFDEDLFFEGYVQFSEYISFVRAMDAFRGMKLIRKEGDKNYGVNIVVNFDRTKHLSDLSTKRRAIVRERLISKEQAKEDEEKRKLAEEEAKKEKELRKQEELKLAEFEKQRLREEKRKEKQLKKLRDKEQSELTVKIREEEKKLLAAQRKLESIRLLEALFERIKIKVGHERTAINLNPKVAKHKVKSKKNDLNNKSLGTDLRNKLVKKIKTAQEKEYLKYKERVKRVKEGKNIISKILTDRSPSVNSISSNDTILHESQKKKRKRKKKNNSDTTDSDNTESSAEGSGSEAEQKLNMHTQMMMPPHGFAMQPVFNPQTGTWMGMYPYPPMFTQGPIRPNYISNSMPIRGFRGGGRGGNPRFPRGRGQYRGRGSYYNSYESNPHYRHFNKHSNYDEQENEHDFRHSRSRSRSSSRSRSRSRSKSYSRSRGRRSRSYTKGRHSRSRSRSHSHSKSKKLVSTRRRTKSPESSRSRTRSSRSSSGWSHSGSDKHRNRKRSWSRTSSRDRSKSKSKAERKPSRFDENSPKQKHEIVLEREKLFADAEKIKKSVQKRLNRENKSNSPDSEKTPKKRNRSPSLTNSPKFEPPKLRERSGTPEKQWN